MQCLTCSMMCTGILCLPVCCLGLPCLVVPSIAEFNTSSLKKLVQFYGGAQGCLRLAEKIRHEITIFHRAVSNVHDEINPDLIQGRYTIVDMVCSSCPRFGKLYRYSTCTTRSTYDEQIWDEYTKLGGNHHVVIYGFGELLCMNDNDIFVDKFIKDIVGDTALFSEIMKHKLDSGF